MSDREIQGDIIAFFRCVYFPRQIHKLDQANDEKRRAVPTARLYVSFGTSIANILMKG
jgi:hypothetical protein